MQKYACLKHHVRCGNQKMTGDLLKSEHRLNITLNITPNIALNINANFAQLHLSLQSYNVVARLVAQLTAKTSILSTKIVMRVRRELVRIHHLRRRSL